MLDTAGSFDPRNLLKKKPTGVGENSGTIPDVQPYQPVGNGIIPTVPFGSGNSNLPPFANNDVMKNPGPPRDNSEVMKWNPTGGGIQPVPGIPPVNPILEPQIQPQNRDYNAYPKTAQEQAYTGNTGKTSPQINEWIKNTADSASDPRYNYGYNENQWAINKSVEDTVNQNWLGGGGKGAMPDDLRKQILGYRGTDSGYHSDLPDYTGWRAHQDKLLQPFNASVQSELTAGRQGHSGMSAPPVVTPNYVDPQIAPTVLPTTPQIAPELPPDDIWNGTQRRKPSYL